MRRLLAALAAALVAGAGLAACGAEKIVVTAEFRDSGDLQTRGGVQAADVRIGTISSIKLTPDFRSRVTMRLDPSVRIPKSSTAVLRTTSLLGEKFVELRPNGDPRAAPYLASGDRLESTEAPELEFVAEQAVTVLGSVTATDVATIVQSGAEAFGGRAKELGSLISDLSAISHTLASRTGELARIIDGLDRATSTLAAGKQDLEGLLTNLAETTRVLAENRNRAVDALGNLSRLARAQDELLRTYHKQMDTQIKQLDGVLAAVARSQAELGQMLTWLSRFIVGLPVVIPGEWTQVFIWLVPAADDCRSNGNKPGCVR